MVLLSVFPPASLRRISGVSPLLISSDIYLFKCSQPWKKQAAEDSAAKVYLPVCSLVCFVAILEIFSAFYIRRLL